MKTMKYLWKAVILAIFSANTACKGTQTQLSVEFDHGVTLLKPDGQENVIDAGQKVALPFEPSVFVKDNRKTLILLPLISPDGHLSIKLPRETLGQKVADERTPAERGRDANEIAQAVVSIQLLISERRADEALLKIQSLRERFKNFTYLGFMEASCFIIKKNLSKAKDLVESTLREFPDDTLGRQFMETFNMKRDK